MRSRRWDIKDTENHARKQRCDSVKSYAGSCLVFVRLEKGNGLLVLVSNFLKEGAFQQQTSISTLKV